MKISKVTPILIVEAIEPCLTLWTKTFGFKETVSVPHGETVGFVILEKDGAEVMMQTRASVADDLPVLTKSKTACAIYMHVDAVEKAAKELGDVEVIVPLRSTPYGAREIWVRDSTGNVIGLAEHKEP